MAVDRRCPPDTARLTFAEMTDDDLDDMAALLGDPHVMRHYPRPRSRAEALDWIRWNQGLYEREGYGLWVVRLRATGEFAGDCGLTPQEVDGLVDVELGFHVRAKWQRRGLATEAAVACREHARQVLGVRRLIAIIAPENKPSQRVAEKAGLPYERDAIHRDGRRVRIHAAALR